MKEETDFSIYDSDAYDVEAMRTDEANGNFSADKADDYLHEMIVLESLVNGQFTQAKEQCVRYGLNYSDELNAFQADREVME